MESSSYNSKINDLAYVLMEDFFCFSPVKTKEALLIAVLTKSIELPE